MPKIENEAHENSIGWTIVGENAEQEAEQWAEQQKQGEGESEFSVPGRDLLKEAIREQDDDPIRFGDEETEARRQERPEAEQQAQPNREQVQERTQPEGQQAELTPQAIQESIERLDNLVGELGLNDAQSANEFATDYFAAFGTTPHAAGADVEALGNVVSKTALSALQVYESLRGDLSNMPEIPTQSAQAFSFDLLRGLGIDPRSVDVDAGLLASVTLGGALNFLSTYYDRYGGKVTDLSRLNDPRASEYYLQAFARAFGYDGPISRQAAVKWADAMGKQILRIMGKVSEINGRQAQQAANQPRGRAQRGQQTRVPRQFREGVKGSKPQRFKTNSAPGEPFSDAAMEAWQRDTRRL